MFTATLLLASAVVAAEPANTPAAAPPLLSYAEAYSRHVTDNKPLLVIVSAEWCRPCQLLKAEVAQVEESDARQVVITVVDYDKQTDLASQVMDGTMLPQLVLYYRLDGVPVRASLVGFHKRAKITELLRHGFRRK